MLHEIVRMNRTKVFFTKKGKSMLMKKGLLLVLFVVSANALHGAVTPWDCYEDFEDNLNTHPDNRQRKAQERAAALAKKRTDAEATFYQQLHHETTWWPNLSNIEPSHRDECIQAITEKYGISGDIFTGSDLVKEAYTQQLIYFIRHNLAGNDPVTFMTYNYKTITLNLNKVLLHKLICCACYELGHGNVVVFDQVIQKYKKFINEIIAKKKSTGLKNISQDRIAQDFHSLVCFWFLKIDLESDSTNFENSTGSCCCCW